MHVLKDAQMMGSGAIRQQCAGRHHNKAHSAPHATLSLRQFAASKGHPSRSTRHTFFRSAAATESGASPASSANTNIGWQVPSYHTRAFLDTFRPYHDERRFGPVPKQYSRQATAFISPEQEAATCSMVLMLVAPSAAPAPAYRLLPSHKLYTLTIAQQHLAIQQLSHPPSGPPSTASAEDAVAASSGASHSSTPAPAAASLDSTVEVEHELDTPVACLDTPAAQLATPAAQLDTTAAVLAAAVDAELHHPNAAAMAAAAAVADPSDLSLSDAADPMLVAARDALSELARLSRGCVEEGAEWAVEGGGGQGAVGGWGPAARCEAVEAGGKEERMDAARAMLQSLANTSTKILMGQEGAACA